MAKKPAKKITFNKRTRAMVQSCQFVLNTPHALAAYEKNGGAAPELAYIVTLGTAAANSKSASIAAMGHAKAATANKSAGFTEMADDYFRLKRALEATVQFDIRIRNIAPEEVALRLERILEDDTDVHITDFTEEGQKHRTVTKSLSDEARRQEAEIDTKALLDFYDEAAKAKGPLADVVDVLSNIRKFDRPRLEKLNTLAKGLAGKLKEAEAKRGTVKSTNDVTRTNVVLIRKSFAALRGLLRLTALNSPELDNVLKQTEL